MAKASGTNLSGVWFGEYRYPDGYAPAVSFIAILTDSDGELSGEISEPNTFSDGTRLLYSVLKGRIEGDDVAFVKTDDGSSDAAHAVAYEGRVDASGTLIVGAWTLNKLAGTFEMARSGAQPSEFTVDSTGEFVESGRHNGR